MRIKCQKDNTFNSKHRCNLIIESCFANSACMKFTAEFEGEMSSQNGRHVVNLLLKTELILTGKMKTILEHPDAQFTIMLNQLKIRIGELLNMILADELASIDSATEGPSACAHFAQRISYIEPQAVQLHAFAASFRFDLNWCSECFHRLEHLATRYKDANCPS